MSLITLVSVCKLVHIVFLCIMKKTKLGVAATTFFFFPIILSKYVACAGYSYKKVDPSFDYQSQNESLLPTEIFL